VAYGLQLVSLGTAPFPTSSAGGRLLAGEPPKVESSVVAGQAMGMQYRLEVVLPSSGVDRSHVGPLVAQELERLESIFSLYRDDSELSRWNQQTSTAWIAVSEDLAEVFAHAERFWQLSDGWLEPTLAPVIDLWQRQSWQSTWKPPPPAALEEALQWVGLEKVERRATPPALRKKLAGVRLDLNALVEGWAIDRIAALLEDQGMERYLFQLGGEFFARGTSATGKPWMIGVEHPQIPSQLALRLPLQDEALSVSGNYRQGHWAEGRRFSHLIDPRSGQPVNPQALASTCVIADRALMADGWATVLFLLGPKRGRALAEAHHIQAAWWEGGQEGGRPHLSRDLAERIEDSPGSLLLPGPAPRSSIPRLHYLFWLIVLTVSLWQIYRWALLVFC
jgi:thiamine biosynthesis lipoprotein